MINRADRKFQRVLAPLFFVFWLVVLYTGADHPPPVGFFWLVLIVLLAALLVYLRVPIYLAWCRHKVRNRHLLVIGDGIMAGVLFASLMFFLPGHQEVTLPARAAITWYAVLIAVGIVNALTIYCACYLKKKTSPTYRRYV